VSFSTKSGSSGIPETAPQIVAFQCHFDGRLQEAKLVAGIVASPLEFESVDRTAALQQTKCIGELYLAARVAQNGSPAIAPPPRRPLCEACPDGVRPTDHPDAATGTWFAGTSSKILTHGTRLLLLLPSRPPTLNPYDEAAASRSSGILFLIRSPLASISGLVVAVQCFCNSRRLCMASVSVIEGSLSLSRR
jgi:hypothetical protein